MPTWENSGLRRRGRKESGPVGALEVWGCKHTAALAQVRRSTVEEKGNFRVLEAHLADEDRFSREGTIIFRVRVLYMLGVYVILKRVIKVSFKSNIVWLVREQGGKRRQAKPGYIWALQPHIPSCLTGNAQVISRLKIDRIYLVTYFTSV